MTEKDFSKMRGKEVSIIFQDPLTSLNHVYTIGNQIMEVIRLHTDADKKKALTETMISVQMTYKDGRKFIEINT